MQQPHPDVEHIRRELVAVVESGEHKPRFRQSGLGARGRCFARRHRIGREKATRQAHHLFDEKPFAAGRDRHRIGQYIVDTYASNRAGITHVAHRQRGRPGREYSGARIARISGKIDRNVDLKRLEKFRHLGIGTLARFHKMLEGQADALADGAFGTAV